MMAGFALLPLIALVGIVIAVLVVIQRRMKTGDEQSGGSDIIAYLVLAMAMGVTGFALVELANTAFPGEQFIFDPATQIATSLAAIVVAAPFLVYFWRRQSDRRVTFPESSGWAMYLALMEGFFLTAFVVSTVILLDRVFSGDGFTGWPPVLIFGAIVVFHEVSARNNPPGSEAGELQRVIGSAIGLITAMIGLAGTLTAIFAGIFDLSDIEFEPWLAMLVVGTPIWAYRWLPEWESRPTVPRLVWTVLVSIGSFGAAFGSGTAILVLILQYLFASSDPAAQHFEQISPLVGIFLTTLAVWAIHRKALRTERTNQLRTYEYGAAAIGLVTAVVSAIWLTIIAFDRSIIVGGSADDIIGVTIALVAGLVVWLVFNRKHETGDQGEESSAWPRRIYTLGLGLVFGLVAAGALIATLFILLRRVIGDDGAASLLTPFTILLYTGLAAWYLLAAFGRDRESTASKEVITPFAVTIICAHPGTIATRFPPQARLRVIHRGDGVGIIDDDLADEIVAAVDNQPSLVWVDADGFRIAPMLVAGSEASLQQQSI